MTLHVGMVGADGISLVGDTWQHVETGDCRIDYGWHASKIRRNSEIAVACARNMEAANRVADAIFATNWDTAADRRDALERIGESVASACDVECLVVFTHPYPSLWHVLRTATGNHRCNQILSAHAIGHSGNPAYFWVMRYYSRNMTMKQLARIGAMVNVSARKFNSGTIDGIEVVECGADGITKWSSDRESLLESDAQRLTERIGTMIVKRKTS